MRHASRPFNNEVFVDLRADGNLLRAAASVGTRDWCPALGTMRCGYARRGMRASSSARRVNPAMSAGAAGTGCRGRWKRGTRSVFP